MMTFPGLKPLASEPPPTEVVLGAAPRTVPAHVALSPGQLEARLQVYQLLAEQKLPLFEPGPAAEDGPAQHVCWGCGAQPPHRENGWRMMPCKALGWVTRRRPADGKHSHVLLEVWCPKCAAAGGFGCVEEPEEQRESVSS